MRISDWSSDVCSSDLPGVDLSALQRAIAAGMLQQDRLDIVLGQPRLAQRAQQEDVRVGAAGDRDALALKVADRPDGAVSAGNEGGPLRLGLAIDRIDRHAAGTAAQGHAAGAPATADRTAA